MLRMMLTCHWSARRIQRHLDADPSAPLPAEEARRLEAHLAVCARCSQVAEDHRMLRYALTRWSDRRGPDPAAVGRLRATLDRIVAEDLR
ncbi:zf-HC2 domain-containing protein [Kineococcus xinjiangensis]|nr:zf-HC2 domain-containing protein [Kineococcus xinjiangensis]